MDAVLREPDLKDVVRAQRRIAAHLPRTPLYRNDQLSALLETDVFVKHENHLPTGAFKVRGGVNLVGQLSDAERRSGVVTASTGNHGQSIAFAAREFGVPATVYVPEGANPVKVTAIRTLGAEIVVFGHDFDDARIECERVGRETGRRYIHSGNEPLLIAGVGTAALEMLEAQPDIDVILVPIGGGSGAAGACIVAKAMRPAIRVIGVQSEAAPAAYRSWKAHELLEDQMRTAAEGLATRTAFALPQQIMQRLLDDFILVNDDELRSATLTMIEATRSLVELAAAAPLAGALRMRHQLQGARVALICSGANISREQLAALLQNADN
ncbi:MAG: threonine/serine dehydratase [Candidatus Dormibacteraeota bacterium]|nr:threonine/serine dehydratase [Candidatus Dormibacteraeota bacterium]